MQFLYLLERIRTLRADLFFSAVTYLGDEAAFLCAVLVIFWCVDKTAGGNSENPPVPAGMQASPGEGFGARTPTVISNRSQFLISHF